MTFTYLSQFNSRILIEVKISSDQKEKIYKAMKEKAFKTIFNNSFTLCKISTFEISVSEKLLQLYFWYIRNINS